MTLHNKWLVPVTLVALSAPAHTQSREQPPKRVFASGAWVEVARITDDAGRIFENPVLIAAKGDTAYVYDGGSQELIALRRSGAVLWRVGRAGRGPREFSNPVDLRVAPNGDLHVLDSDVSRITIVDPAGRIVDMRQVEERLHRIVPRSAGWWAVSLGRPELLVAVGANGRTAHDRAVPAPADVASRHVLVRESFVAPTPNGGTVVAFVWSSRLIVTDAEGIVAGDLQAPEQIGFAGIRNYAITEPHKATVQRIDPKARIAARDLTANDSMALVLFGGSTGDRGRLLDRYDLRAKRYVDSARLPRQPAFIRLAGQTLVALERDPAPAVVWYQWRPSSPR